MKTLLTFFILAFSFSISAQQNDSAAVSILGYDVVALADGSILCGKIIQKASGMIRFRDKTVGELTFRASQVKWSTRMEAGKTYRVYTNSHTYIGKLSAADTKALRLETSLEGIVVIPYGTVTKIEQAGMTSRAPIDAPSSGDANYTRYLLLPNAIPPRADELYYKNTQLICNSVHYSISDHLSVSGGLVSIMPYLTVRGGWKLGEQSYIGGMLAGGALLIDVEAFAVGGFGTYTYGTEERNISLGAGYGSLLYGNGGGTDPLESPVYTISAMTRAGRRAVLMTENWIVPIRKRTPLGTYVSSYTSAHMIGLRIISERRTWDIGMMSSPYFWSENIKALPVVNYSFRF